MLSYSSLRATLKRYQSCGNKRYQSCGNIDASEKALQCVALELPLRKKIRRSGTPLSL
jgi:hypothetical protein